MSDRDEAERIFREAGAQEEWFTPSGAKPEPPAEGEPPEHSDDALALAFSDRHAGQLLHVPEWGAWLRWDGCRWAFDKTLAVYDLARLICREAAIAAEEGGRRDEQAAAAKLASAQKVSAVERLARADRRHARPADAFDADPWALNTPGGVVDLRTGGMRQHGTADLFTKVTAVAPGGDCPRWRRFLNEIMQGDAEAIAYAQRWCGYALTGSTREHAFLFLYGPGGNGKSVLLNTLAHVMGDYATTADMELFTVGGGNSHPTGLADLRGARLVLAQETEQGRALAEAKIKAMTGGDRIKARFMRQDFFEFQPVFKLVMTGNHRPVIRNPDEAMRRRLHLLPLTYKPPAPDRDLAEALQREAPGILAWAIEGCMAWQSERLGSCPTMLEATAEYFAEQDLIAQWLAERCEAVRHGEAPSSALFRDWQAYAKDRGEEAGTSKTFSAALERHHAKKRKPSGVVFLGLRLRPSDTGVF
ncbi:phage/plasmid primase, P4 family [Sediminicoccus rosea]|uniref:Phage/plasmid primase, P4 family n=1 Tax=Sediminicoccus rosea TaxID=1225128 RepID=A0ABZ0PL97_9PROT|nr:phage/plasmid primase, P4 family [Sediminicoccus rosea]WPB86417.1 phage/plasmid primase, P4 family [Sediminicoccus rosea]